MNRRPKRSFDPLEKTPAGSWQPLRIVQAGLIGVVVLLLPVLGRTDNTGRKFTRFQIEDGLSQSAIRAIAQDSRGFMWFGTEDGLNRYDGFNFKIFRHDPENADSLSLNYISVICADRKGHLWIGTEGGGLNRLDPGAERFIRFRSNPEDPAGLSDDYITALAEDPAGRIWVGTTHGGLNRFEPETGRFVRYRHDPGDGNSLSLDNVTSVVADFQGRIWAGTRGGGLNMWDPATDRFTRFPAEPRFLIGDVIISLCLSRTGDLWIGGFGGVVRFDPSRRTFRRYPLSPRPSLVPDNPGVWRAFEDSGGAIWIGTMGDGLDRLDPGRDQWLRYRNDPNSPSTISNDVIFNIFEDSGGVLWVGTENGLNKTDLRAKKFGHYNSSPADPSTLSDNYVKAFEEDSRRMIWVGTLQGGLNIFDPVKETVVRCRHVPNDPGSPGGDRITSLAAGTGGAVWIGLFGVGFDRYDPGSKIFRHYRYDSGAAGGLSDPRVMAIREDQKGAVWIGTQAGLNRYDPQTGRFTVYKNNPGNPASLSHDYVYAIFEDHAGRIWIGTFGGGLNLFVPESGTFVRYRHRLEDPASLSQDIVTTFFEDADGILWIGTTGGFNRFDPSTGVFRRFTDKSGLPNNSIYGILGDSRGALWITTNMGLSRFDPGTGVYRNFDVSDGLQSNEFNGGAAYRTRSGEMYFGGINGITRFFPDDIVENSFIPPIALTDLRVFGRSVFSPDATEREAALRKSLEENRRLALTHRDRMIEIEFAAMHFAAPAKNRYMYKMEGFDKNWNQAGIRRFATYTNLPGGDYVFKIRASNSDGAWSNREFALEFRIIPPFWRTWWFRGGALAALLLAILVFIQARTFRIRAQNRILEKRVGERTQKLKEANLELEREVGERKKAEAGLQNSLREKEILLKEIHHRVKNNLQVVSSFINIQARSIRDEQIREIFDKTQDRVQMMARIHENLYKSRDLAGIEAGPYLRETVDHLSSYISDPGKIGLRADIREVFLDIDSAIPCGLIVNELVTNAVKYAFPPEMIREQDESFRGEIVVSLRPGAEGGSLLTVKDNGVGLPEGLDFGKPGSLGLHLVNGLVAQLHGTIRIERKNGTEFKIAFGGR
jgi:two-component sensor histidine kinase/ligand-binding sensor domain-containing protein